MTIWISRELPLFYFEHLDMWCAWMGHPSKKFWQFEFLESFRCWISKVSMMRLNQTSELKVMTIWIFRELPLSNFERLDILCAWIWLPCEKLLPFEFVESFYCLISSVSICDAPESDIRVKIYDHLNFSRAFVVQFRASRHIMRPNQTCIWIV